ncbi:MAG TPA: glycosyl hydrolase [Solirubrobacterales bacterium]|nr:glycosyl hydrolase [Solirubrobacterales bacterium]
MARLAHILGLQLALLAVFAVTATASDGAPAPRLTLSVPTEVSQGVPAVAKGKVMPLQRGRVLLQVWRAHAWRTSATGRARQGGFRISFVLPQATPSSLRVRATLVRGGRTLASSPVRKVLIQPNHPAPEPKVPPPTTPTPTASLPATSSGSPPPAEEPPANEEPPAGEEEPPAGEEEPPPPPPGNAYWGAWIGSQLTGKAAPWDMSAVTKFEQMTGKPLSLIEFSSPWADCSSSPCTDYAFPWDPFNSIRAHGSIPFFSWGSESYPGTPNQPEFQLADIISGAHDNYIRTWATRAAEWGHPFFLRFDWEMNGNWFPWGEGANENQPGEFVEAWRHVHKIFTSVGATNATWVWCPYANHLNLYASLYPGDSYVDWTCLDGYNWGENPAAPYGWRTFDNLYEKAYAKVVNTIAPSKPMVIGEVASSEYGPTGTSKAGWIEEMFEALEKRYPKISALIWFETLSNGEDWPLESSVSAEDAFAAGISDSRFLGNVFGSIETSPIPAP